jgi:hypothetical protein
MKLRPTIASHSTETYQAIRTILDARAMSAVERVATSPARRDELDSEMCGELLAMRVFREEGRVVCLDTAVFLEEDIRLVQEAAAKFGADVAGLVAPAAAKLRGAPPVIINLLVGIAGIGQSVGQLFKDRGLAVRWEHFGGRYPRCKVDFDEICDAYEASGQDLQSKTVLKGTRCTAVFIGPGGVDYRLRLGVMDGSPVITAYVRQLNVFLTDAFAALIRGELEDAALQSAAHYAGLYEDGRPRASVLTNEAMTLYLPILEEVKQMTCAYFAEKSESMCELLRSTTSGRQGVPSRNMMMHLWRYVRKAIARELYTERVFTDAVPDAGLVTVFYENSIQALDGLFS